MVIVQLIWMIAFSGFGQNTYSEKFYTDFVTGDMESWQKNLNYLKADYQIKPLTQTLFEIVKAQYGLIAYFIGVDEKKKAAKELGQARKNIDILLNKLPNNKNLLAWKGAFYGFELGIAPWKVLYYGPQSQEIINEALAAAKNYPESNFEYANMLFWAPALFGGNKLQALIYYNKAVEILENQHKTRDWYYLWVLTAYSNALNNVYGFKAAKPVYTKIITLAPDYQWINEAIHNLPEFNL